MKRDDDPQQGPGAEVERPTDASEHALGAWPTATPPAGFADGVLAALAQPETDAGAGVGEATAAALDIMALDAPAEDASIDRLGSGDAAPVGGADAAPGGGPIAPAARGSAPTRPLGERQRARLHAERPGRDGRRRRWLPWAAAALAAGLMWGAHRLPTLPSSGMLSPGEVAAGQLSEVRIADRAVAVSDAEAALAWTVALGGATAVKQRSGRVFYRVQPGGTFEVETPAGRIRAHGTCFEVQLLPGAVLARGGDEMARFGMSHVMAGALGAALASVAVVSVYEGRVSVESARGAEMIGPGERVVAAPGQAPRRLDAASEVRGEVGRLEAEKARLLEETEALKVAVKELAVARTDQLGLDQLVDRHLDPGDRQTIARLVQQVAALEKALEDEQDIRAEREGEAFPFPPELPRAFSEQGLREAFESGLSEVGLAGEVNEIDCSEFPCIVYGSARVDAENRETMDERFTALNEALAEKYGKDKTAFNVSVWGTTDKTDDGATTQRNDFAFAMFPKDAVPEDDRAAMTTRLRYRNEQAMNDKAR